MKDDLMEIDWFYVFVAGEVAVIVFCFWWSKLEPFCLDTIWDKLMSWPLPLAFFLSMLYLAEPPDYGVVITFDEREKIFQAENARRADEIIARRKRGGMKLKKPEHKAQKLDDGIYNKDIPIEDLMQGFKGFL